MREVFTRAKKNSPHAQVSEKESVEPADIAEFVSAHPGSTARDIAEYFHVAPETISRKLKKVDNISRSGTRRSSPGNSSREWAVKNEAIVVDPLDSWKEIIPALKYNRPGIAIFTALKEPDKEDRRIRVRDEELGYKPVLPEEIEGKIIGGQKILFAKDAQLLDEFSSDSWSDKEVQGLRQVVKNLIASKGVVLQSSVTTPEGERVFYALNTELANITRGEEGDLFWVVTASGKYVGLRISRKIEEIINGALKEQTARDVVREMLGE
jgi:hypothetical protein